MDSSYASRSDVRQVGGEMKVDSELGKGWRWP